MIACIGETLEQRESGPTMAVAQIKAIAGQAIGTFHDVNFTSKELRYLMSFLKWQNLTAKKIQ